MKKCFKCGADWPLNQYYRHSGMKDGYLNKCKKCARSDVSLNRKKNADYYREYDVRRQKESIGRLLNHRYIGITQRTEGRASRRYKVEGLRALSYDDYKKWTKATEDDFYKLYNIWAKSGYKRKLTPSIDRIDGLKGYEASNMQWMTLSENCKKG